MVMKLLVDISQWTMVYNSQKSPGKQKRRKQFSIAAVQKRFQGFMAKVGHRSMGRRGGRSHPFHADATLCRTDADAEFERNPQTTGEIWNFVASGNRNKVTVVTTTLIGNRSHNMNKAKRPVSIDKTIQQYSNNN